MRLRTLIALVAASLCYIAFTVYVSSGPRPLPPPARWVNWLVFPITALIAGYSFLHCEEFASHGRRSTSTLDLKLLAFLCLFSTTLSILGLAATLLFPLALVMLPAFIASLLLLVRPNLLRNAPVFRKYLRITAVSSLVFVCCSLLALGVQAIRGGGL
ncbi:hypothetical protein Acid345_0169 [Candidatus Koribacter versatilis Ellin345]|uniref:Uncharacterized protein n=1 Tax=Koribacter versatilis (strain Ellin345) TaxID=204669 RepID=Q1IVC6_KORVE|nr:hypothetical protein [Candidatus Koribacter versatilis]ABF39174.1 hypothetical protein Acid345_0169 [Candidatus Koribacter versatilis Ellin345]